MVTNGIIRDTLPRCQERMLPYSNPVMKALFSLSSAAFSGLVNADHHFLSADSF